MKEAKHGLWEKVFSTNFFSCGVHATASDYKKTKQKKPETLNVQPNKVTNNKSLVHHLSLSKLGTSC